MLPKRGSVLLQTGVIEELDEIPVVLVVFGDVAIEQSATEAFDSSTEIIFDSLGQAIVNNKFIRATVGGKAQIKKDPFTINRRRR